MDLGPLTGLADGLGKVDPLNNLIDIGASLLGLPPEVKSVAKLAVGVAANDPILIINGAVGLMGSLSEAANAGPATELPPWDAGPMTCPGYLPRPPGGRPGDCRPPGSGDPDDSQVPYPLDPNLAGYRDCLRILKENFPTFDTAVGAKDGRFGPESLEAIRTNPEASGRLKRAAGFLLDHPEYYNRLDMAASMAGPDRAIGLQDIQAELSRVDAQLRACAPRDARAPHAATPLSPTQGYVRDVISNPEMSLEEKMLAVFQNITESTDREAENILREMESIQDQRARTKDDKKARGLDRSYEMLNLRLQRCIERRSQMFQLMSNMSSKFNEMAKVAIQNMARA